jgi:hypothetical protein
VAADGGQRKRLRTDNSHIRAWQRQKIIRDFFDSALSGESLEGCKTCTISSGLRLRPLQQLATDGIGFFVRIGKDNHAPPAFR